MRKMFMMAILSATVALAACGGKATVQQPTSLPAEHPTEAVATIPPANTEAPTPEPTVTEAPAVAALALLSSNCLNDQARGSCKGKVKNIGTTTFKDLNVNVAWIDSSGQQVEMDHQWTQEGYTGPDAMRAVLNPGEEWNWEVEVNANDTVTLGLAEPRFEFCELQGQCVENVQDDRPQ